MIAEQKLQTKIVGTRALRWMRGRDLDPVWERERERVNRDALTRLKTLEGSADSTDYTPLDIAD